MRLRLIEAAAGSPLAPLYDRSDGVEKGVLKTAQAWAEWIGPAVPVADAVVPGSLTSVEPPLSFGKRLLDTFK